MIQKFRPEDLTGVSNKTDYSKYEKVSDMIYNIDEFIRENYNEYGYDEIESVEVKINFEGDSE